MKAFRRLPPLNALRSYEAAARHRSFTKAAEELGVTPAAVSFQVRMLEDYVGVALLQRVNRQLVLTDAGEACLPGIRGAFESLTASIDAISVAGRSGVLTVSVAPSFASKWLLPRLHFFQEAHPDIDVRVSASMQLADFASGEVDLAIRYGTGRHPGLVSEQILAESVIPVCSPKLLECADPLRSPDDIRFHTLLHDDSPDEDESCPTWEMWLNAAGVQGIDATRGPRFDQSSMVLEAAALGRGIALAKSTLAAMDLAEGRLIKPFELSFPVEFAYYVVYPDSKTVMPKVGVFICWLKEQADAASAPRRVSLTVVNEPDSREDAPDAKMHRTAAGTRQRKRMAAPRPRITRARRSLTAL
jgi:LysR family transcriptional regulator, glycine cleavage system transcriptional activator